MKMPIRSLLLLSALIAGCDSAAVPGSSGLPGSAALVLDTALESQLTPVATVAAAYHDKTSGFQVLVRGTVTRLLSDDTTGSEHQRLIVKLSNDQTLLIAHNTDLATRVPTTCLNKTIYVFGQYEWNSQGGVVHWTHIDPSGSHLDGWIQYLGARYQ
jgi:hypothetical protein